MVPKRIGIMIPSTNTAMEADFQRLGVGRHVTVHSERLFIPDGEMSPDILDVMNADLASRITSLASAKLDVIVYGCTSGSFYKGADWDQDVVRKVEEMTGVPCITTSGAVATALRHVQAQRLSIITPYPAWTNQKLVTYYEADGFEVLNIEGDARAASNGHRGVNDQDPEAIFEFGAEHFLSGADALFCSCTAWRAMEVQPRLEKRLRVPVITSNQATIWAAFGAIGRADLLPSNWSIKQSAGGAQP